MQNEACASLHHPPMCLRFDSTVFFILFFFDPIVCAQSAKLFCLKIANGTIPVCVSANNMKLMVELELEAYQTDGKMRLF